MCSSKSKSLFYDQKLRCCEAFFSASYLLEMRTAHAEERTLFILSCYRQAALIPLDVLRCVFMFCVIALYALMGTPTPDRIGLLEIVIGALLFTVIIRPELYVMWKRPFFTDMDWPQAGRLVLFFAVSVPFLGGVMQGNAPALILRDVIWLGFITLPVLLAGLFSARQYRWLVVICVAGGVILALREIVRVLGVHFFCWAGQRPRPILVIHRWFCLQRLCWRDMGWSP